MKDTERNWPSEPDPPIAMSIVDLRQTSSRQIEPLLAEESQHWRDELRWDYRPSLNLIKKFVDAKSLAGCVAMENGRAVGYTFYVVEDHKALIGGLHVSSQSGQPALAKQLLSNVLETLRAIPGIERIEAQLIPFGFGFDETLSELGFRIYPRQFMFLEVDRASLPPVPPADSGLVLERWDNRHFSACARLIQLAYANHTDGEINDQYRSEAGALKFLKNIVILPGCGQFLTPASFVLRAPHSHELIGAVLTSTVAPGTGHTTQICVMPGYQRHGLGQRLMAATITALRERSYAALSLTVTSSNQNAVLLYDRIGFQTTKRFTAGVWLPAARGWSALATIL
jgi:ribosomal protein S18 acetylase RimI-like enzyme